MKPLKTEFRKNELNYTLLKRNEKVALFLLGLSSCPDGYEVCRIHIMKKHKAFGVDFEESEIISSNDQFYADGSGSFRCFDDALKHFDKLSGKILRQSNVEPKSPFDTEVIVECQTVEDNAIYAITYSAT
jgi:hypothetical protein